MRVAMDAGSNSYYDDYLLCDILGFHASLWTRTWDDGMVVTYDNFIISMYIPPLAINDKAWETGAR